MSSVVSSEAELASKRIMETLAQASSRTTPTQATASRLHHRAVLLPDPRHSLVLPHITAIAEDYSRRLLIECSERVLDLSVDLMEDLWKTGLRRAEGSWETHSAAWAKWFGIDLRTWVDYPSLLAFVQARNAIIHGLGDLTRRQIGDDGGRRVKAQLASVGIATAGRTIILTTNAVRNSALTSRAFIEWLDLAVQARRLA